MVACSVYDWEHKRELNTWSMNQCSQGSDETARAVSSDHRLSDLHTLNASDQALLLAGFGTSSFPSLFMYNVYVHSQLSCISRISVLP